jgi:D-glycerate 3-kinase
VALGAALLDSLARGESPALPCFDKAADDRAKSARPVVGPVDVVLFEGWCVGAMPQPEEALAEPLNRLEREEDAQCLWRREVNRRLHADYAELFARLDLLLMLRVPSFDAAHANRLLQERKLARRNPAGARVMDEPALDRFMMHYERLTRWMLAEMPARVDILIPIGTDQRPTDRLTTAISAPDR